MTICVSLFARVENGKPKKEWMQFRVTKHDENYGLSAQKNGGQWGDG
jgi:hypothetical protein